MVDGVARKFVTVPGGGGAARTLTATEVGVPVPPGPVHVRV
jgi:hypothetical protein